MFLVLQIFPSYSPSAQTSQPDWREHKSIPGNFGKKNPGLQALWGICMMKKKNILFQNLKFCFSSSWEQMRTGMLMATQRFWCCCHFSNTPGALNEMSTRTKTRQSFFGFPWLSASWTPKVKQALHRWQGTFCAYLILSKAASIGLFLADKREEAFSCDGAMNCCHFKNISDRSMLSGWRTANCLNVLGNWNLSKGSIQLCWWITLTSSGAEAAKIARATSSLEITWTFSACLNNTFTASLLKAKLGPLGKGGYVLFGYSSFGTSHLWPGSLFGPRPLKILPSRKPGLFCPPSIQFLVCIIWWANFMLIKTSSSVFRSSSVWYVVTNQSRVAKSFTVKLKP